MKKGLEETDTNMNKEGNVGSMAAEAAEETLFVDETASVSQAVSGASSEGNNAVAAAHKAIVPSLAEERLSLEPSKATGDSSTEEESTPFSTCEGTGEQEPSSDYLSHAPPQLEAVLSLVLDSDSDFEEEIEESRRPLEPQANTTSVVDSPKQDEGSHSGSSDAPANVQQPQVEEAVLYPVLDKEEKVPLERINSSLISAMATKSPTNTEKSAPAIYPVLDKEEMVPLERINSSLISAMTTNIPTNTEKSAPVASKKKAAAAPEFKGTVALGVPPPESGAPLVQEQDALGDEPWDGPAPAINAVESRGEQSSVGAHAIGGPGALSDGDIESHASGVLDLSEANNSPVEPPILEATLVDEATLDAERSQRSHHTSFTGGGSEAFSLGGGSEPLQPDPEPIFEAKPVSPEHTITKRTLYLLVLLVLVCTIAIVLAVTIPRNSGSDESHRAANPMPTVVNSTLVPGPTNTSPVAATKDTLYPTPSPDPTSSPTNTPMPMLQRIRSRGVLRCGVFQEAIYDIFAVVPGKENSFEAGLCRAIAAAVMGRDRYQVELIETPLAQRVEYLESGIIDVLFAGLSWTMDRDVYLAEPQRGLAFTALTTTMSSGYGGIPKFVACAQDDLRYLDECADMIICVLNGTRFFDDLADQLPRNQLHLVQTFEDFFPALQEGTCNVFASTFVNLNFIFMHAIQNGQAFESGQGFHSFEPFASATRAEDHQWTDFCAYVMRSIRAAEYHNITSESVINKQGDQLKFQRPTGFGEEYKDMFIDAVAAIGNMGELYKRTVNPSMLKRENINFVNNGTTGIIHSLPLGQLTTMGPSLDTRFEQIFSRGKMRCAIRTTGRPGFAERVGNNTQSASYSGMDVDFCLAIAASIFNTPVDTVEFLEVVEDAEGFDLLHREEADILAGVMGDLERDVKDPQTGVGFSFSVPYFHNSSADGSQRGSDANLCLATREDYNGWSDYVFWIVQAIFYAEEENITRSTANNMPTTNLYGQSFTRIFRDAISAVGNYGEIYERNVQTHIPRQGLNFLADKSNPTPLFYVPPGMFE